MAFLLFDRGLAHQESGFLYYTKYQIIVSYPSIGNLAFSLLNGEAGALL
jgi:hypothetical protein